MYLNKGILLSMRKTMQHHTHNTLVNLSARIAALVTVLVSTASMAHADVPDYETFTPTGPHVLVWVALALAVIAVLLGAAALGRTLMARRDRRDNNPQPPCDDRNGRRDDTPGQGLVRRPDTTPQVQPMPPVNLHVQEIFVQHEGTVLAGREIRYQGPHTTMPQVRGNVIPDNRTAYYDLPAANETVRPADAPPQGNRPPTFNRNNAIERIGRVLLAVVFLGFAVNATASAQALPLNWKPNFIEHSTATIRKTVRFEVMNASSVKSIVFQDGCLTADSWREDLKHPNTDLLVNLRIEPCFNMRASSGQYRSNVSIKYSVNNGPFTGDRPFFVQDTPFAHAHEIQSEDSQGEFEAARKVAADTEARLKADAEAIRKRLEATVRRMSTMAPMPMVTDLSATVTNYRASTDTRFKAVEERFGKDELRMTNDESVQAMQTQVLGKAIQLIEKMSHEQKTIATTVDGQGRDIRSLTASTGKDREFMYQVADLSLELTQVLASACTNKTGGFLRMGRHDLCDPAVVKKLVDDANHVNSQLPQQEVQQ